MTTNDVRDFMAMLGIVPKGNCYSYRLDNKKEKSIGAYPLKRSGAAHIPIGGMDNTSYGVFPASFFNTLDGTVKRIRRGGKRDL